MKHKIRLVWLTDIHLEFIQDERSIRRFCQTIRRRNPDAVIITGDIGVAANVHAYLSLLHKRTNCPIYFVLGNHDYYHGGLTEVRQKVDDLNECSIVRLDRDPGTVIPIADNTALIGVGGWGDGRAGLGEATSVRLNDQLLISDFAGLTKAESFALLRKLGDESAAHFLQLAPLAFSQANDVLLATHVPPFLEASLYKSDSSDPSFSPYFVCVALGNAILQVANEFPHKRLTVLCGHTHFPAEYRPMPNVVVKVAGSIYGHPRIAGQLELPNPQSDG